MIYLQAPWDLIQATVQLPNPNLGNLRNNEIEVNIRNAMNGTLYSYVKSSERVKLSYDIRLSRLKALELETFIDYYAHVEWRLVDWNDVSYRVALVNEPFDFTRISLGEETTVRLELEGTVIA